MGFSAAAVDFYDNKILPIDNQQDFVFKFNTFKAYSKRFFPLILHTTTGVPFRPLCKPGCCIIRIIVKEKYPGITVTCCIICPVVADVSILKHHPIV